jgi:hypothetical protein
MITGDANTAVTNAVNASRLVIDMKDKIHLLEPSANPLTVFMKKARSASCHNPKFEWLEDEATPVTTRVNNSTDVATDGTELIVDEGDYFAVDDLVLVQRTGEVFRVSSESSDTLTIARGWAGTETAGEGYVIVDNDSLTNLGGNFTENDGAGTSIQTKLAEKYNYTEICRNPFGLSNTLMNTNAYGGDVLAYTTKARGIEHAKDIEMKLLFGERAVSSTAAQRSMGGINYYISTNSKDFGGGIGSLDEIFDAAEDDFRYGSKEKMLLVSRQVASNISLLAADLLRMVPEDKSFGIHVQKLITPHGIYNIVAHDLLEGDTFGGYAFVVDMNNVSYRFLQNRDTKLVTNIQTPGQDGRKDEYLTEAGLECILEKTHGKWTSAA